MFIRILLGGIVASLFAMVITLSIVNTGKTKDLDTRLAKVETKVADQYTLAVASEVALRTAIANPGFQCPDPRDPTRLIQVTTNTSPRP